MRLPGYSTHGCHDRMDGGSPMADKITIKDRLATIPKYFSPQDLGVILVMAVLAFLTSSLGLESCSSRGFCPGSGSWFPETSGPGCRHLHQQRIHLPLAGPGAAPDKKTWDCNRHGNPDIHLHGRSFTGDGKSFLYRLPAHHGRHYHSRSFGLLAIERKPWSYVFPVFLALMGVITLVLMAAGQAKMGENGAAATVFPLGYAATGIIALCLAVICFMYPMKYVAGAGISQMFYITYCWLFNGSKGFATWVPAAPAIPTLLAFALVCGSLMAAVAYGIYLIWKSYNNQSLGKPNKL